MSIRGETVAVCANCRTASCWLAEFVCDDWMTADVIEVDVETLRSENREHPDAWEKLWDAEEGKR